MHFFLHHRDLRYQDNTTMIRQMKTEGSICPLFIFTPEQINPSQNPYFSHAVVQFMIESLKEYGQSLEKEKGQGQGQGQGQLYYFYGHTLKVLQSIHQQVKIDSLGFNRDYSPYARKRDEEIMEWAEKEGIRMYHDEDHTLYSVIDGSTFAPSTGKPYTVYTPFMRHCQSKLKVREVDRTKHFHFQTCPQLKKNTYWIPVQKLDSFYTKVPEIASHGGRKRALEILKHLSTFRTYDKERNYLTYETTHLSAYINFNVISIRELYHTICSVLGKKHGLMRELIWRDFYIQILYYFPRVVGKSFRVNMERLPWKWNSRYWKAWTEGRTGFPVVDAGMRQLNATGFCHNRSRMIVATFLTKMLHIDWRKGEQYFAQKLIDYNVSSNNGGWQWSASTGTDSQPYFRMFHYGNQLKNYDPNAEYVKRWIPELRDVPVEHILEWEKYCEQYQHIDYPKPIVDYKKERLVTLEMFRKTIEKK